MDTSKVKILVRYILQLYLINAKLVSLQKLNRIYGPDIGTVMFNFSNHFVHSVSKILMSKVYHTLEEAKRQLQAKADVSN